MNLFLHDNKKSYKQKTAILYWMCVIVFAEICLPLRPLID
jgi:hypothetical protein